MNEVNMLNIGGVDYNIDDQYARDLIAHSENGLDSQSNLPISSRHYDEGEYLIGQDRYYYEATTDIDPGDVLAEGTNLRKTLLSDEIVSLKNQSSIAVIQCIAKRETGALATSSYPIIGSYLYWDFGLTAGLYETIAAITAGDALTIGVNLKSANKIADMLDGLQDAYNITGAKNLCPNEASDTTTTDITWDVLSDGSVQVSGTAAANRYIQLNSSITLPAGTYTITTGQANENIADVIMIVQKKSNNEVIARSNSYELSATFTLAQATDVIFVLSTVHTNVAINVRIFPMCRVASITDDTYVPYAMTNRQLTDKIMNPINETFSQVGSSGIYWRYIKSLRVVEVYVRKQGQYVSNSGTQLGTLPSECPRPYYEIMQNVARAVSSDTSNVNIGITTSGAVYVTSWAVQSSVSIYSYFSYHR